MSNMLMASFLCDALRTVNRFIFASVFPLIGLLTSSGAFLSPPAKTFGAELRAVPQ